MGVVHEESGAAKFTRFRFSQRDHFGKDRPRIRKVGDRPMSKRLFRIFHHWNRTDRTLFDESRSRVQTFRWILMLACLALAANHISCARKSIPKKKLPHK